MRCRTIGRTSAFGMCKLHELRPELGIRSQGQSRARVPGSSRYAAVSQDRSVPSHRHVRCHVHCSYGIVGGVSCEHWVICTSNRTRQGASALHARAPPERRKSKVCSSAKQLDHCSLRKRLPWLSQGVAVLITAGSRVLTES